MTSLPVEQGTSVDFSKPAHSVLSSVPIGGSETRCWRDTMISTSHADISIRETTGEKLPILLLHGGGLCKETFDRQLESSLGARHRMIAIDLPGHGASGDAFDPDRTYRIEGLADVALEVLESLGIDNAVVVGASLGGWVGLEMLQTFPGLVGLTLTATLPGDRATPPSAPKLLEVGRPEEDEPTDDEVDAFLRRSLGDLSGAAFAGAVKRTDARATKRICDDIRSKAPALWPVAASASATPIMVVNGARSVTTQSGDVAAAAARSAGGNYAIPHAGPAPFLDAPMIYNHLLEGFMQRMMRRERQLLASPTLWYGG